MNVRNSEKIQDKWLLFQRFVTSIVDVTLCNNVAKIQFKKTLNSNA